MKTHKELIMLKRHRKLMKDHLKLMVKDYQELMKVNYHQKLMKVKNHQELVKDT